MGLWNSYPLAEATACEIALANEKVKLHLEGREPRRVIYVQGRLINIVP